MPDSSTSPRRDPSWVATIAASTSSPTSTAPSSARRPAMISLRLRHVLPYQRPEILGGADDVARRGGLVVGEDERALLDAVEQLVDARFGVAGDDERRTVPAVRDLGLDERVGERLAVGRRP